MPGPKKNQSITFEDFIEIKSELQKLNKTLTSQLNEIKSGQDELRKSAEFFSDKVDELTCEVKRLSSENASMKRENEQLKAKMMTLEHQVNELDQYHRRINLEVAGVPEKEGENVREAVLHVMKKISPEVSNDDIDVTHRLGQRREDGPARPIIVRFTTRRMRDTLYSGRKKLRETSTRQLGFSRDEGKVFLNENLAPAKKSLLKKANDERKKAGYKFLWTTNGTILVRKSPNVPPVAIHREEDLNKIK
ncbi:uncharacterized protein LOC121412110 [Lytechinus variegatus]|uniref:uncharacterized protein LOC121412110 n=1 Tax=Lytechinus variegatus TaxID=7654 RepID=UPI001BB12D2B|nr:uncharacterized protein LOC121412110 [Lytechinus variegatus]